MKHFDDVAVEEEARRLFVETCAKAGVEPTEQRWLIHGAVFVPNARENVWRKMNAERYTHAVERKLAERKRLAPYTEEAREFANKLRELCAQNAVELLEDGGGMFLRMARDGMVLRCDLLLLRDGYIGVEHAKVDSKEA